MIFGGLLDYVIVVFLVLVFAEYAKIRAQASKQFNFIAGSAIWALLAIGFVAAADITSTGFGFWTMVPGIHWVQYLFEFLAWLWLLIGAVWTVITLAKGK